MKWIKELIPYVLIIIVVVLFRSFIATPVRVDGPSMNNTLADGQILILNKLSSQYERMDIIVFRTSDDKLIKRVIGLPGDHVKIENNKLYINNNLINDYQDDIKTSDFDLKELGYDKIPEGYYFVLGDNRYHSVDSRMIGLVNEKNIEGNIIFRIFPFGKFGKVK